MRITEFNRKVTATALNESAAALFGQKLNLESFTLEQLYDARNKLRTRVSQFESSEQFSAVNENETIQKNKLFLDVLNQAIQEREEQVIEFTDMEKMILTKVDEGLIEFSELPDVLQQKVQASKNKSTPVTENVIVEGEEERAELIMSARDMVDRVTGWMEDTANMQAEAMLELVDSIRDELGTDISQQFEGRAKPALAAIYAALETSRQQLIEAVGVLTGESEDQQLLGDEPPMDDTGLDDLTPPEPTDDFAATAAAAGGEEAAGRPTRESIEYSRKVGQLFAPKKK